MHSVTSNAVRTIISNINGIEQTANTSVQLELKGFASPDSTTAMNVVLNFPFYIKNTNYSYTINNIFFENIGQKNSPTIENIRKSRSGISFLVKNLSGLSLYNAYNVRFATVIITFA